MSYSFLEPDSQSLFNPALRFAWTNITDEKFISHWNGEPITVEAHQTVELPHHLMVKFTKELVDKIMIGEAKLDELQKNQPYYRSPKGSSLGVPAARKVWEDQIVRQMEVDEESPEMQVLRAEVKDELLNDMNKEKSVGEPAIPSSSEFSEIKSANAAASITQTSPPAPSVPSAVPPLKTKRAYKPRAIKNPKTQ